MVESIVYVFKLGCVAVKGPLQPLFLVSQTVKCLAVYLGGLILF